ncbi:SH3 domain-containing protein [Micrococcus flavus]|uniref:Uncharacterized protein YraI n=1 Tax=Micrococcus flavus TaxID=384602 RepID=A0A4Y8X3I0_9MICC|nr:SH3 domain-containing protein [Micrococcus flavus]MBB4882092.1 uncharacterized protein YraI [Micrococcus flavus]TFI03973.1 SH3 domain-containing protein [Micrococcus flavus]GGK50247.1 hypothetical protein GCM10007073_16650 [Micrococcus flavus]
MTLPSRRSLITGAAAVACAAALPAAASAAMSAEVTLAVYLRATPTWGAVRLHVIPQGALVSLTGRTSGGWNEVVHLGRTGWVASIYLVPAAGAATPTDETTLHVWLRATPSWSAARIVVVPAGESVARTGRVSGAWVEVQWQGRTGWIADDYLRPLATTAAADTRLTASTVLHRTFTSGDQSSVYHVWADGIDWSTPVGVLFYLDGDYFTRSTSRMHNPTAAPLADIAAEANRRNLVCIAVDTPDVYRTGLGYTWWKDKARTSAYFRAFAAHMTRTYRLAADRQWLYGYSGGAEIITISLMAQEQDAWGFAGGGAVILAGGGVPATYSETRLTPAFRALRATWVVGSEDTAGETYPQTWSALGAATAGHRFYADRGFTRARLDVLPGLGHHDYDLAGVLQASLDAAGVTRRR